MINVYSSPQCGRCTVLKHKLRTAGIEFNEIDVTKDISAMATLEVEGLTTLPVVEIESEFMTGEIDFLVMITQEYMAGAIC